MSVIHSQAKKWGNSLGLIIPRHIVEELAIKEGQSVDYIVVPRDKAGQILSKVPPLVFKSSTQKLKDEARKALW